MIRTGPAAPRRRRVPAAAPQPPRLSGKTGGTRPTRGLELGVVLPDAVALRADHGAVRGRGRGEGEDELHLGLRERAERIRTAAANGRKRGENARARRATAARPRAAPGEAARCLSAARVAVRACQHTALLFAPRAFSVGRPRARAAARDPRPSITTRRLAFVLTRRSYRYQRWSQWARLAAFSGLQRASKGLVSTPMDVAATSSKPHDAPGAAGTASNRPKKHLPSQSPHSRRGPTTPPISQKGS